MSSNFFKQVISVFFICLYVWGCSAQAPEELDRLIKEDPQFKQMISSRDQIHLEKERIKNDILLKKEALDSQIAKLRDQYDTYSRTQKLRAEKLQLIIDNYREQLKKDIEVADTSLAAKEKELEGYQKTMEDLNRVLNQGQGIKPSSQDKKRWEEHILMLSEKIRPLADQIQELKLQIRLKKQKIGFLH